MIQQYKQGTTQHIYEVLDEIHATSNPAYILTDYAPVQDTIIEVKYKVNGNYVYNHNERIFSIESAPWNVAYTVDANYSASGLSVKFPNPPTSSGWRDGIATRDTTTPHILKVTMNECYYDGTLVATGNGTFASSVNPIIISSAAISTHNDQGYHNLYYFNISEDNTLIHQYVPARRISDDAIGFYDYVDGSFLASTGTFAYTAKSTPEYIDETTDTTVYVNNIMFNGNHINRIYLNGEVYWGNNPSVATPPPIPTVGNTISGTASVTSQTVSNAIKVNGTTYSVNVDANGEWTLQLSSPVNSLSQVIQNNLITSIDLRDVEYDTYCDLSNAFCINKAYNLTDIWFDFRTAPNTNFMSTGALLSEPRNVAVHGLGTLQWSGRLNQTSAWTSDPTSQNCFSLREMFWANIIGTLDIRGIDTSHINDIGWSVSDFTTVSLNSSVGYFYRALYSSTGSSQRLDTLIIGNLKIISNSTQSQVIDIPTVKTLYVTTTDTSCLGNSSFDYVALMSGLEHIYVPVGSLNDFINDSSWGNYASIISEQDAPDPMLI